MRKSRHRRDPRRHRALTVRRNGGRRARPARREYIPRHGMRGGGWTAAAAFAFTRRKTTHEDPPSLRCMGNMGLFENVLLLVGKVPGGTQACPAM